MSKQSEVLTKIIEIMKFYGIEEVPRNCWIFSGDVNEPPAKIGFETLSSEPSSISALFDIMQAFFEKNPRGFVRGEKIELPNGNVVRTLEFLKQRICFRFTEFSGNGFQFETFELATIEEVIEKLLHICRESGIIPYGENSPTLERLFHLIRILKERFQKYTRGVVALSINEDSPSLRDYSLDFHRCSFWDALSINAVCEKQDEEEGECYTIRLFYPSSLDQSSNEGVWVELIE